MQNKKTAREIINGTRKEIASDFLSMMKSGETFWQQPWFSIRPFNPVTKTKYKGVNYIRLCHFAQKNGYNDPRWMTFKQIEAKKWRLKKGAQGCICEYWAFKDVPKKIKDKNGNYLKDSAGNYITDPNETETIVKVNFFKVFNAADIEGIEPVDQRADSTELGKYLFENSPVHVVQGDTPRYDITRDSIELPLFSRDDDKFYEFYVRLVESTSNPSRIKRELSYEKESFVDQLGAAFLAADTRLPVQKRNIRETQKNCWVQMLEEDPDFLFKAARAAEHAVGWISDVTGLEEEL